MSIARLLGTSSERPPDVILTCGKSFSDSEDIFAKGNIFMSTKNIKTKHPKNLFFGHFNANSFPFVTIFLVFKSPSKAHLTYS